MIGICTPTRDTVGAGFAFDLAQLMKRKNSDDVEFFLVQGTLLSNMRNVLVRKVLDTHLCKYVLFIDSDMRFPVDLVDRLLAHDLPIVAANCRQRTQKGWTARKGDDFVSSENKTGLEEVDTVGTGVMLIKDEVFWRMGVDGGPWFFSPWDTQEKKMIGEDVYFCVKAKEAGFKIMVDHDLSQDIKHVGSVELGI